ncbi:MAG TPA: hypothetical protein VEH04_20565 [Verrucomicrobiae bacterium]|nr:hypothetical protein [Verrucomicrobiae bacterium]
MNSHHRRTTPLVLICILLATALTSEASAAQTNRIPVRAANFKAGAAMSAFDGTNQVHFLLDPAPDIPFSQSAIKQSATPAAIGHRADVPYFTVRFAMPNPPVYSETEVGALAGVDPMVFHHNHSPGFEILPNGDALAIYFSTPMGKAEADVSTCFVQARLRYGSEDWDMPELFFKTKDHNDQSGLLWNDDGKIWFFGGGRAISDAVPFRIATSSDNGATWTFSIPQLDKPARDYTAQPITSAFRGPDKAIYFAMDGTEAASFLWRSRDDGAHWHDMGGRTGGRHSAIVPLDDQGRLLSIGGKNSSISGWSPQSLSTNWGATWSSNTPSPFPPLGTAQRPSLIRLASGNLLFASDSYMHKLNIPPPAEWMHGNRCFVALSTNNGVSWHVKTLPVQIPAHHRTNYPSLGYVTARQAPNGVIHLLTTVTLPPLHYEFNEAWIRSDAGDISAPTGDGTIRAFSETFQNGKTRSTWSARITPSGRYLLHGEQVDYFEDGAKQHLATYVNGRKVGAETFWSADGKTIWTWRRDMKNNRATWTHFWPNGQKKIESQWNIRPEARDLKRNFYGNVADGPARHWDSSGKLVATYRFVNGVFAGAAE